MVTGRFRARRAWQEPGADHKPTIHEQRTAGGRSVRGQVQKRSTVSAGRDFTDGPLEEVLPMLSPLNFIPDTSAPNGFTALMSDGAPC